MTGERVGSDNSQYIDEWESGAQRWQQSCAVVDPLLERYAKRLRGVVEKNLSPVARELSWQRVRGLYAITMILEEDGNLRVWGTVWKNDEDLAKKRYLELPTIQLETPVDSSNLASGLHNFVDSLRKKTPQLYRSTAHQD